MKVCWTETAVAHLSAIHAFISRDSPGYAQRVIDRLTRRSEQIALFPLSGRAVPEAGLAQIREVMEGPYRIVYYIKPDQIDVVAIIHGAQQTPWTPSPENQ
jgi:plasmid stabilization system protein ParE